QLLGVVHGPLNQKDARSRQTLHGKANRIGLRLLLGLLFIHLLFLALGNRIGYRLGRPVPSGGRSYFYVAFGKVRSIDTSIVPRALRPEPMGKSKSIVTVARACVTIPDSRSARARPSSLPPKRRPISFFRIRPVISTSASSRALRVR